MKGKRLPPPAGYEERVYNPVLDVSVPDSTPYEAAAAETAARFGRIDVLVNSAGCGAITNFEETGEETIRRMLEVNLFGLMRMTKAVLPVMRRQRSGQIFNIASGAGYCGGPVPYHTSKFAVTGFSASLAFEVQPFGIHVTNVAPGLFRTGFYDKRVWGSVPDLPIKDYDPTAGRPASPPRQAGTNSRGIRPSWRNCFWRWRLQKSPRCICRWGRTL